MPNLNSNILTLKSLFSWLLYFLISPFLCISVLVLLNVDIMPAAGAPNLHRSPGLPCTAQEYKFWVLWFTVFPYSNKDQCDSSPQFHTTPWPQHCILIVQAGKSRCWKLCWLDLRLSLLPATSKVFSFYSVNIKHRRSVRTDKKKLKGEWEGSWGVNRLRKNLRKIYVL